MTKIKKYKIEFKMRCYELFPQDLLVTPKKLRKKVFKRLKDMKLIHTINFSDIHELNYLSLEDFLISFFAYDEYYKIMNSMPDFIIDIYHIDETNSFLNSIFNFICFKKYTDSISFKEIKSEKRIFWDFNEKWK